MTQECPVTSKRRYGKVVLTTSRQKVLDLAPIAVGDNEEMKLVAKEIATRLEVSTNKIGYLVELLRNDPDVGIVAVSIVAREISLAD